MPQDEDQQRNFNRPYDDSNLQHTPPGCDERAAKNPPILLPDCPDGAVEERSFLVSVGKVVVGLAGPEEGDDEEEGTKDSI